MIRREDMSIPGIDSLGLEKHEYHTTILSLREDDKTAPQLIVSTIL
mgnify:FL=1